MASTNKAISTQVSTIVVDSGATTHMINQRSAFTIFYPTSRNNVRLANNTYTPIVGYGTEVILLINKYVKLQHVLYVPGLHSPFLSVRQ